MHALRYEVINGPRSVAQTERKCYRGILGKATWGERFSPGKLRHDVGEQEREVAQILLGWLGSQEGIELALQPVVIEVEELVAFGGTGLQGVYP
jgi:hypothetical protein